MELYIETCNGPDRMVVDLLFAYHHGLYSFPKAKPVETKQEPGLIKRKW